MPSYFRHVPDFEYVSRKADTKNISEYSPVKNLFKRGKLKEDIFNDLTKFTQYKIIGDDRPDTVAFKVYKEKNYPNRNMGSMKTCNHKEKGTKLSCTKRIFPWSHTFMNKF